MAEVEADSAGTSAAASDEGFDLGADLEESATIPATESSASDSYTGTTDFDPSKVDFGTADPESLPVPYRDAQAWAKTRERELQGDYTRKTQELADYRRQVEQAALSMQQTAATAAPQSPAADPLAELRRRLGDDASAVDVVQDIVTAVNADSTAQQQTHQQQLGQLQTAVQALTHVMVNNQSSGMNQQVAEAREAYGDKLDTYADHIKALVQVQNHATRQPFTVKEAFELASGLAQAKSQELQATERQVRSDASHRTALNGAVGAANTDDGDLSPEQLRAGLQRLGFE